MKLSLAKLQLCLKYLLTCLFFTALSVNVFAVDDLIISKDMWKNVGEGSQVTKQVMSKNKLSPLKVRSLELDEINFKTLLNDKAVAGDLVFSARNNIKNTNKKITLPLPDGSEVRVEITPSFVMSDALAKQYPQIQTWDVKGVTEDIVGTIDFNHKGFHGMLMMPDGDRVFIEPDFENASLGQKELSFESRYISFSNIQNKANFKSEFSCGVHDDEGHLNSLIKGARGDFQARPASNLITYRLAVAATGEYSQFHGGTVEGAMSAITTTISRVNQIYRRDFGIQFVLVDEQSDIIYLDPDTDPYTNSNVFSLIQENDINLSDAGDLSKSRYDIGHVFGEGNVGGLAVVGGVCNNNSKAFGATGISSPVGDVFDLDFVAHELGHQLGASHTFNSACSGGSERTGITAVEPGSGTTIMAYPGLCQENDIQNTVDPQFHIVSIDQITTVTRSGIGSSCGVQTATGNENPIIDAGVDMSVPARTPLVFIAEGTDTDNDALTYSWEQTDTGTISDINVDTGNNALFRSRPPTSENIRFIPKLSDLFANTSSLGEVLPITDRDINMAATIRDGNGGLDFDLVRYEVSDTGQQFSVTSQMSNQSFGRQDTADIRWNVAGTSSSPISCATVDIGLVTEDGQGIDITTTANDGRDTITIPNDAPPMSNARIIVSCSTSNFFNVSSGRITILDQVGGGSGADTDTGIEGNDGGGGGGSFNFIMLLWGLILVSLRIFRYSFSKIQISYKNTSKLSLLSIPIIVSIQACSAPISNEKGSSSTDSAIPKKFGDRFSIEKIKQEREAHYAQKRLELKKKSPVSEVKKALQSNNIYHMAISGNRGASRSIPGLVEPQAQIVNCRVVSVEGFGDALYGKNHISYRQEMLAYMREFNTLMSPYCK